MAETTMELTSFFEVKEMDAAAIAQFADLVYSSGASHDYFREIIADQIRANEAGQGGDALRIGVALVLVGQYSDALAWLGKSREERIRRYFAGEAQLALGQYEEAINSFQKAAAGGWDAFDAEIQVGVCQVRSGDLAAAEKTHKKLERSGSDRAAWYFLGGLIRESRNEVEEALGLYEKALTLDESHEPTMFRAARLCDLRADDERAVELYTKLAVRPRAHVNALINLAVLYEDRAQFDAAIACLRRVLAASPNHTRARLFLKDVESSRLMIIDDSVERKLENRNRLLEMPVAEFELSVRARNCLKKMKVQTLGDLIRLSEPELLSYKNFGETSLNEIRALLSKRGLKLGMNPEEVDVAAVVAAAVAAAPPPKPQPTVPPGSEALLAKPVSELELSVRARRCLQRLNVHTLGELIQHNETDLLATRNFGVTSLSEIKQRLTDLGLGLAPKL